MACFGVTSGTGILVLGGWGEFSSFWTGIPGGSGVNTSEVQFREAIPTQ